MATVYVDTGEAFVVDVLDGTISIPADYYIGWGTGSTAANKTDTALEAEKDAGGGAGTARVTTTDTQPLADTNQFVGTITATGTFTVAEAGLFTASTSGTLIIRGVFTGIGVESDDAIEFTFKLQQT